MKIVCATDFSSQGEAAAEVAVELARRAGGTVELVHVTRPWAVGMLALTSDARALEQQGLAEARGRLTAERDRLAARGVPVSVHLVVGEVEAALLARAADVDADLIVTGTHARSAWQRFLVGSAAEAAVRVADRPVLVVPPGVARLSSRAGRARLRVTVALDARPAGAGAVAFARELAARVPCDVTFFHLYWAMEEYERLGLTGPRDLFTPDPDVVTDLERQLRLEVGVLPGSGRQRFVVRPGWGEPAGRVLDFARSIDSDLLVVGTESRRGFGRLSSPAVASRIAHQAAGLPVVFAPPAPNDAEAAQAAPQIFSVLAPTDLSPAGNRAIPFAYRLLAPSGGVVQLCHVHERVLPAPAYVYEPETGKLTDAERTELEAQLRALVPPDAESLGITTHVTVIEGGRAAEAINQAAERLVVDAVVLASHGRGRAFLARLGSISRAVVEHARRPVLVVPSRGPRG